MAISRSQEMRIRLSDIATVENTRIYKDSTDKYAFCLNLLRLKPEIDGDGFCDFYVNRLENHFEILSKHHA